MGKLSRETGGSAEGGYQLKQEHSLATIHRPPPSSSTSNSFHKQRHKLPLALPPSTNSPDSFKYMYQSAYATDSLPSLVSDVVPRILSFCDARTLSRASCVCQSWSNMANANELWTELCIETFGVAPSQLEPPPDPTKMLYLMSHLKLRETLCLGRAGMGSRGWSNNIQVISASAFRSFGH